MPRFSFWSVLPFFIGSNMLIGDIPSSKIRMEQEKSLEPWHEQGSFIFPFDEITAFFLGTNEFDVMMQFSFDVVFQDVQRDFRLLFFD